MSKYRLLCISFDIVLPSVTECCNKMDMKTDDAMNLSAVKLVGIFFIIYGTI